MVWFVDIVLAIQQEVECDTIRAKAPAKNKGSINVLTILIQFQDVKFEHPTTIKSYFEYLMELFALFYLIPLFFYISRHYS